MKKGIYYLLSCLLIGSVVLFSSCEDDPVIDPTGGDINVANGLYLALDGENPSSSALLSAETVEAEGFTSQTRDGFVGGYMFLEAGSYGIVEVTDKEVTKSFGGVLEALTDAGSDCDLNEFMVVSTEEDGASFSVATSALYRVTHDQLTNELLLYAIESPELIGDATEGGWSTGTILDGTVDATGGTWSKEGVILRSGVWKVRFNCRWSLDRRTNTDNFDVESGYQLFTNFGGSATDLANGNDEPNIDLTDDGTYTVTMTFSPRTGWAIDLNRTGDAPTLTFNANDYKLGILGSATANMWDADRDMIYKFENDIHSWYGVVTFAEEGEFKIRANDAWDFALGGALASDGLATEVSSSGANIVSPGAGSYYIVVSTADEGVTWSATMVNIGWSLIGEGSPTGAWDMDTDLTPEGFTDGISSYFYIGEFSTGEFKFRAGHDWKLALGGTLGTLTAEGENLSLNDAGSYKITLTFDGSTYSAIAEPQ